MGENTESLTYELRSLVRYAESFREIETLALTVFSRTKTSGVCGPGRKPS
jgi:hypothetical protein